MSSHDVESKIHEIFKFFASSPAKKEKALDHTRRIIFGMDSAH